MPKGAERRWIWTCWGAAGLVPGCGTLKTIPGPIPSCTAISAGARVPNRIVQPGRPGLPERALAMGQALGIGGHVLSVSTDQYGGRGTAAEAPPASNRASLFSVKANLPCSNQARSRMR